MKSLQTSHFRVWRLVIGVFLMFTVWGLKSAAPAAAAASQTPQGITVSPAFQMVSIPQGAASQPIKLTVINHESVAQTINITTQDFNTLSETGGLFFVGANPTQLQKKYGLAKWIELPQKQVTIQPGQAVFIKAGILNLPSLAPGGHYGAIMISLGNQSASTHSNVAVHPIASSLLFVTKLGGDTHKLSLAGVQAKHNLFKLPSSVTLRFYNNGNTHVVPRGIVTITDGKGGLISKGIINENSDIVLPQTYRLLSVPLQAVSAAHGVGKYNLLVSFRFDGISQFRNYQTSFWYAPAWAAAIVLILIALIAAAAARLILRGRKSNKKS